VSRVAADLTDPTQNISLVGTDIPSFEAHVLRVAHAGVSPLIAGSMGEAIHLARAERTLLIKAARKVLDGAGHYLMPIIAGTGAASTRETLELCSDAAAAGADYCIVIASGYFAGVWGRNKDALRAFFVEVAQRSPIPVMIYNCEFGSSIKSSVNVTVPQTRQQAVVSIWTRI
jgi:4-hydroxy-2-oxoglutarate aldolase